MKAKRSWFYDGMRLGGPDGREWRVFEPRWWQLRRWLLVWNYHRRGMLGRTRIVFDRSSTGVRIACAERIR